MDKTNLEFKKASAGDLDAVFLLYCAAVGTDGCTWDNIYPSRETAKEDFEAGSLYVLRRDKKIIGAVSVVPENELDGMNCFTVRNGAREFARITVMPEFRGRGYAGYMLKRITNIARNTGVTAWHILAATCNHSAIALYRSFGFSFLGECGMYGNQYYICEKVL